MVQQFGSTTVGWTTTNAEAWLSATAVARAAPGLWGATSLRARQPASQCAAASARVARPTPPAARDEGGIGLAVQATGAARNHTPLATTRAAMYGESAVRAAWSPVQPLATQVITAPPTTPPLRPTGQQHAAHRVGGGEASRATPVRLPFERFTSRRSQRAALPPAQAPPDAYRRRLCRRLAAALTVSRRASLGRSDWKLALAERRAVRARGARKTWCKGTSRPTPRGDCVAQQKLDTHVRRRNT
jgi:hypothetical protein